MTKDHADDEDRLTLGPTVSGRTTAAAVPALTDGAIVMRNPLVPYSDDPDDPYWPEDREQLIQQAFGELTQIRSVIAAMPDPQPWDRVYDEACEALLRQLYAATDNEPDAAAPERAAWLAHRTAMIDRVRDFVSLGRGYEYITEGRRRMSVLQRVGWRWHEWRERRDARATAPGGRRAALHRHPLIVSRDEAAMHELWHIAHSDDRRRARRTARQLSARLDVERHVLGREPGGRRYERLVVTALSWAALQQTPSLHYAAPEVWPGVTNEAQVDALKRRYVHLLSIAPQQPRMFRRALRTHPALDFVRTEARPPAQLRIIEAENVMDNLEHAVGMRHIEAPRPSR